jgi:anti-sigma factor RsiW
MSGAACSAAREAAPELALGILDGEARAEALMHLADCPACQRYVDEMTAVADALNRLAPEVEPPVGFARRVDATIRGERRRSVRRWVTTVAVTAAAAVILSVTVVRVIDFHPTSTAHPVAAPALRSVAMVGSDGLPVGHVAVSSTSPASLVVNVDYNVPDGTYGLQVRGPTGAPDPVGMIAIIGGHGEWTGSARLPAAEGVSLDLVGPGGSVVCQAAVNQPQAA